MVKVSILINCHNSEKFIEEAINSALNQSFNDFEIICFDNKSTDNTKKIINSYDDRRLKYFYSKDYLKLGDARNQAIKNCSGEFIAFLDSDDIWYPHKLTHQIPFFKDRSVGIVVSNTLIFHESSNKKKNMYPKNKIPKSGMVFRDLFMNYNISLETAVVRASILKNLDHIFDPRFEIIEEYDLFCRIALNFKVVYLGEVLAKWRYHQNSYTWRYRNLLWQERLLMLNKFDSNIKNFNQHYYVEIKKFKIRTELEHALYLIQIGDYINARKIIKNQIFKDYKFMIIYFITLNKYLTKILLKSLNLLH